MKGKPSQNPVRVLIIDDDFFVRDALKLFVRSCGCLCKGSPSAEEAMAFLQESIYDIVVCDYRLPGLDGLAFFRRIQGLAPKPLKILISAYGHRELIKEAERIGLDGFFQKPFSDGRIEIGLTRLIHAVNDREPMHSHFFPGGRQ